MIRDILRMGDARLLERSREVAVTPSAALDELLADMRDTMRAADGAGLAAPQIGVPLRVVFVAVAQVQPREQLPVRVESVVLQPVGIVGLVVLDGLKGYHKVIWHWIAAHQRPAHHTRTGFQS